MVRMLLLVVVCIGLLPIQMRAQKNSYIIPGKCGRIRTVTLSMRMAGDFFTTTVLTTGMENIKRAKRFCLIGLHGSVIVQM